MWGPPPPTRSRSLSLSRYPTYPNALSLVISINKCPPLSQYRGTSLIRNRAPLGPHSRIPGAKGGGTWTWGPRRPGCSPQSAPPSASWRRPVGGSCVNRNVQWFRSGLVSPSASSRTPVEQLLYRNVKRFQGGLVFKAHRLLYHSTLGLRVIKKTKKTCRGEFCKVRGERGRPCKLRILVCLVIYDSG